MLTFNNNIPGTFFKVQQVGTMVQIKPFAGYYIWLDWFDLAPLDFSPAIDILTGLITDVNDVAVAAAASAADAAAAASTAQAAADAAQVTADAALAAAGGIDTRVERFMLFGDELLYLSGTPGSSVQSTFPYNWITFTTTLNAQAYVILKLRPGTWTIKILTLKRNDCSKLTVTLNAVGLVTNLDLYSVAPNLAYVHTLAGVTVADNPEHELLFLAAAKNAASSSHVMSINKVWGYRTGA